VRRLVVDQAVAVENLVKDYPGPVRAIDGVSFEVESGSIFGFLGPNGAGKSTAIRILTTLALPTQGRATVSGFDVASQPESVRRIVGVALQEIGIDPLMKPLEMLTLQGKLFGSSRAAAGARALELVELIGLTEEVGRRAGTYSVGMRRRLDLAMALVHEPRVLFLDEPTTGLDPASRRDIWQELRRLNGELGITIFLTTQNMEEADELAERVVIIDRGRIAAEGSPARLKASVGSESLNLLFETRELAEKAMAELATAGDQVKLDRDVVRVYERQAAEAIPRVLNRLRQAEIPSISLTLTQPTLDDVFLQVTGRRLETHHISTVPGSQTGSKSGVEVNGT
jgi:ABC-2 type transport system ATP-binding protein